MVELADPNIASYSPTATHLGRDHRQILQGLAEGDPRQNAWVMRPEDQIDGLVQAHPAELRFIRGGFEVMARSSGRSLLILPIQFTHCMRVAITSGDSGARLIRVNLAMTGLVFDRQVSLRARVQRWPLRSPGCQRADLNDAQMRSRLFADRRRPRLRLNKNLS